MCKCVDIFLQMNSLTFDTWSLPMVFSPLMSSTQFVFGPCGDFQDDHLDESLGRIAEWISLQVSDGETDDRCEGFHFAGWFMGMGNPNITMAYYIYIYNAHITG